MTYSPEERKARNVAAQARFRVRHPERVRTIAADSRDKHRDKINAAQRAAYRERKAAGTLPPSRRPKSPVTGTLGAIESPDTVESTAPNLREKYLLALLIRDAKIWHQHRRTNDLAMAPDDGLSPQEATRITPHTERNVVSRPMSEAEKERRRAAWTPERREAMRRETAARGKEGGDHGGKHGGPGSGRRRRSTSSARADALAAGRKTYIRDIPCPKCGSTVYLVSNWSCTGCKHDKGSQRTGVEINSPRISQFRSLGASNRATIVRAPRRVASR